MGDKFTRADAQKIISTLKEELKSDLVISEDGLSISYKASFGDGVTEIISFKAEGNNITNMTSGLPEMGRYSWIYKNLPEDLSSKLIEATKGTDIETTAETVNKSNNLWHGVSEDDSKELKELKAMTQPTVTPSQLGLDFSGSEDIGVGQREVIFTDAKSGKPVLASFGAGPCVIIAAYNPETKEAGLAHVDANTDKVSIYRMLKQLKGNSEQGLEIHLAGATQSSGGEKTAQDILNVVNSGKFGEIKTADIGQSTQSESLAIDARTGKIITDFNPMEVELARPFDDFTTNRIVMGSPSLETVFDARGLQGGEADLFRGLERAVKGVDLSDGKYKELEDIRKVLRDSDNAMEERGELLAEELGQLSKALGGQAGQKVQDLIPRIMHNQ